MKFQLKAAAVVAAGSAMFAGIAVAAAPVAVTTEPAAAVTNNAAQLRGALSAHGGRGGAYLFQYGLTPGYGLDTVVQPLKRLNGTKQVRTTVTGLIPGTLYHFRVIVGRQKQVFKGADMTFKTAGATPIGAITGPAIGVLANDAAVSGELNPNGPKTKWYFQYGPTPAYGLTTTLAVLKAGMPATNVARRLTGLTPGTLYHFRIIAFATNGPTYTGADNMFFTVPSPLPRPKVTLNIHPRVDTQRPFVFKVSGRLKRPKSIPAQYACNGSVILTFRYRGRLVRESAVHVQPNCHYFLRVVFHRMPHFRGAKTVLKLTAVAEYKGDHYLSGARSRRRTATLG